MNVVYKHRAVVDLQRTRFGRMRCLKSLGIMICWGLGKEIKERFGFT